MGTNRGRDEVPDWEGFANAPRDEDGKALDFRDVDPYDAERDEAVKAPSSIAQFKTDDKSTDGYPAAVVPAPLDEAPQEDGFQGDPSDGDEEPADGAADPADVDPEPVPAEGEDLTGFAAVDAEPDESQYEGADEPGDQFKV
jgi:hypothetical protein